MPSDDKLRRAIKDVGPNVVRDVLDSNEPDRELTRRLSGAAPDVKLAWMVLRGGLLPPGGEERLRELVAEFD